MTEMREHLDRADDNDDYYWCPSEGWQHFHAWTRDENCMGCGVEIYDAKDGTGRYKARRPYRFIIQEEPV